MNFYLNAGLQALTTFGVKQIPTSVAPATTLVSKFLLSGGAVTSIGKQSILQVGAAFTETKFAQSISPTLSAGLGIAFSKIGSDKNLSISAGLSGIAGSATTLIQNKINGGTSFAASGGLQKIASTALGAVTSNLNVVVSGGSSGISGAVSGMLGSAGSAVSGIATSLFGKWLSGPAINPSVVPPGSLGNALPPITQRIGAKGLLRAMTANQGLVGLKQTWGDKLGVNNPTAYSSNSTKTQTQDGMVYNSSEGAYGMMIKDGANKFKYTGNSGEIAFTQIWTAGGDIMRKNAERNEASSRIYNSEDGKTSLTTPAKTLIQGNPAYIENVGGTGITIQESKNTLKPGVRYGDSVGTHIDKAYFSSEIMIDYAKYSSDSSKYPTKRTDAPTDVTRLNESLQRVIAGIEKSGINKVNSSKDSISLPTGENYNPSTNGYNKLFKTKKGPADTALNYPGGVMNDYKGKSVRMIDNSVASGISLSRKMPTNGYFDAINTLEVLDKNKSITNSKLKGWSEWKPYEDDLIAFFFYDVVNEKYIPFRATFKGINESGNASWEEMPFIGRSDKVYSYGGFVRGLSIGFKVVIGSIAELAPTWKRINYLATLIKPANYTKSTYEGAMNRFMVPPMMMLTVGDLYKDQPVLLQTFGLTIPDDSAWETLNEDNSNRWEYLSSYINSPSIGKLYGQLPREVEISLGLILLEKERAIVGGANFGHAPRNEDWSGWNTDTVPDGKYPNDLNQSLVVDVTGNMS